MWWRGRSTIRRREVRRTRSERSGLRAAQLFRRHVLVPGVLLGLFAAAACFLILYGQASLPYRIGQRIDHQVTARVEFVWHNPVKRAREQDSAKRATPNVYRLDGKLIGEVQADLQALTKAVEASEDYAGFRKRIDASRWPLSESAFAYLKQVLTDKPETWRQVTSDFVRRLADSPVIWSKQAESRDPQPLVTDVTLIGPEGKERNEPLVFVHDLGDPKQFGTAVESLASAVPEPLQAGFKAYLTRLFRPTGDPKQLRPIYFYDNDETLKRMARAAESVDDKEFFRARQVLLEPGLIDNEAKLALLKAEHEAYLTALRTDPDLWRRHLLEQVGLCGIVVALTVALAGYTYRYKRRVLQKYARTLGLAALVLAAVAVCRWLAVTEVLPSADRWAVLAVVFCGSLLAVAYDQRYAAGVTMLVALLGVLALRGDWGQFVLLCGSAMIAIAMLDDIRTRTKLVVVGLVTGVVAFGLSFFADLASQQTVGYAVANAGAAAAAGFVAGLLLQGLLPIIERAFGVVTSVTLLEWCDINKPLLRRLAHEAPGTYNHALVLGSMAETTAEAIGANGLLARVGAYYHDIGKINKPRYFVENQESVTSWHERLAPTMSLLIIIGHVKDGLELAQEYGLPRVLWPFIAEHHGTTLVRYFYHQAAERQADQEQPVTESDFRYPGPKPRSKETAILMLCDSVEGAVRALSEPTPGRIEGVVHQIVMDRLVDGQFNECDITLRELHKIEEALVKSLCAIYHGRIAYPASKEPAKEVAREKAAQPQTA